MDLSLETTAIYAVRDYLVKLLTQGSWCKARQVGQALEYLVNMKNQGQGRPDVEGGKQEDLRAFLER